MNNTLNSFYKDQNFDIKRRKKKTDINSINTISTGEENKLPHYFHYKHQLKPAFSNLRVLYFNNIKDLKA